MDTKAPPPASQEACAALAWLEAMADDPLALKELSPELRARLHRAVRRVAPLDRLERRKLQRQRRRALGTRKREHDDALLDGTSNRALKRSLRFPVAPTNLALDGEARLLLEAQAASGGTGPSNSDSGLQRLREPRACYICKDAYDRVHAHYDSMCPDCAELNWHKRHQTADLTGRVGMVTGARVKIGYETVMKLLRAGAHVVATTRFPIDAARRFAHENDFREWQDRLEVHGLDLRHVPSVETLARHFDQSLPRLDFLVHNACQTVRRPPDYYTHLMEGEVLESLTSDARSLLERHLELTRTPAALDEGRAVSLRAASLSAPDSLGITHAAALTQLDLLGEKHLAPLFPAGIRDGEGQQLDLRRTNSWRMELADVPTIELLEVQLVNSIAPFVLTARLKPLMLRVASRDKHVVNVSAMEGQFNRRLKTTRHPHTNMAKAALNMMTRTSAADFVKSGIHMNSVDTGWVTDEDPFERSVRKETEQRFVPPLDSIDGAARVLDPIFQGFLTGTHAWGKFLKDYVPTEW